MFPSRITDVLGCINARIVGPKLIVGRHYFLDNFSVVFSKELKS